MISLLGSITMVSIATYFFMACLYLITEKGNKLKNRTVILSFICWSVGGLFFIYSGSYAEAHGMLGASASVETLFSILSLVLLGKVFFSKQDEEVTNKSTNLHVF